MGGGERRGVRHLTLRLESKSPRPEPFQPGAGIRQGPGSDADLPPPMGRIDFGLRLESDIQFRPGVGPLPSHFDLPSSWVEIAFVLRSDPDTQFQPEVC